MADQETIWAAIGALITGITGTKGVDWFRGRGGRDDMACVVKAIRDESAEQRKLLAHEFKETREVIRVQGKETGALLYSVKADTEILKALKTLKDKE